MKKKISKEVRLVLEILNDEIKGNAEAAIQKLADDYSMTWMVKTKRTLFPRSGKNVREELEKVYPIKGRRYDIRHIAEGEGVVMVEMIESYPDPKTKKIYRTPLVIVLEFENGKIKKGRHYCDPDVSYLYLSKSRIQRA